MCGIAGILAIAAVHEVLTEQRDEDVEIAELTRILDDESVLRKLVSTELAAVATELRGHLKAGDARVADAGRRVERHRILRRDLAQLEGQLGLDRVGRRFRAERGDPVDRHWG